MLVIAFCAASLDLAAFADGLPNFDKRERLSTVATPQAAPKKRARAALEMRVPDLEVDVDSITGAPKFIHSRRGFLTGPGGSGGASSPASVAAIPQTDRHRAVKAFLNEHKSVFGHDAKALDSAETKRDYVTSHSGMRTVVWQQRVDKIPVFEALLNAHLTAKGELINIASKFVANPEAAANAAGKNRAALEAAPAISARQALALAAANIEEKVAAEEVTPEDSPQGSDKMQHFKAPGLSDVSAHLVWLPINGATLRLCWDVNLMSKARNEMYRVLVDAQTGEAHVRHCLTNSISDATYRVYTSDSPSPFSPGWTTPNSGQPPLVARTLLTLPALDTTASPNGWINDGVNETLGNNVDAHLDLNADNVADLPRPHGSPNRVFDFAMDLTQSPTTYRDAAVTQLFYWCNFYHDKLYALGFTEAAGNFQTNNFGRGGLGNDAVLADAQDGSGTNNANFSTPSDGSPGRMQMYVFTGPSPQRDGDFDADVILHEFTHGLSNRLVGGGVGISQLATQGMGEGWSDFYAMALLSEASDDPDGVYAYGGYVTYNWSGLTQNYYFGIRRYPYSTDMTKNPLTFKDIDPNQDSAHTGVPVSPIIGNGTANEVHNVGEVWCVTLREARANLIRKYGFDGNQLMLQLVTDGMKLSPSNPNFLQARDAIIQADLVKTGGANKTELWAAFAKRGMGASASAPGSSTTNGVIEAFDLPDDLVVSPVSGITASGPVGGPFSPSSQVYTLTNSGPSPLVWSASRTSAWLSLTQTGGTLASGSSTTVTAVIAPAATQLGQGIFTDTITFGNVSSGRSLTRSVRLSVGQPDYFTEFFDTSASDVHHQTFTFVPNGSTNFYAAYRDPATTFPTSITGGTSLTMSDDTSVQVTLSGTNRVQLYGTSYSSFYVGSNGYITFGSSDITFTPSLTTHFSKPRIAALFDDLLPTTGKVTWRQLTDRVAVTYNAVTQYGLSNSNSFQIEMFFDGRIRITYLALGDTSGLVGLSRGTGLPANFTESDFSSYGTSQILTLTVPASATETAGVLSNQGIVRLPSASGSNVVVTLNSSNTTDVTVPSTVTITAGQTSASFSLTILDNAFLDGSRNAQITAAATGYATGLGVITINDNETATLSVSLPSSAVEGSGTSQGTVTMSGVADRPVSVGLSSSDTGTLQVSAAAIIPAGQSSATFPITIVDDTKINGTHSATITAHVTNWTDGSASMNVLDNENRAFSLTLPLASIEGAGTLANAGTVSIPGTLTTNLVVSLGSSDATEITVPSTVTITAGQTSASFDVTVVDDAESDGVQSATITASAATFATGLASIAVADNEVDHFTISNVTGPISAGTPFTIAITAEDINGAAITNFSKSVSLLGAGEAGGITVNPATVSGFVNGVWTGSVSVNTISSNVQLVVSDGARHGAMSNSFTVIPGPLDHLAWSAISSPQPINAPIPVTITAQDAGNNPIAAFTGPVILSGRINQSSTSSIVISEVDTGASDAIEFTNVSGTAQNIGGWQITVYDVTTWPAPTSTFTIPSGTTCSANQAFLLRENGTAPGTFPNFNSGSNFAWVNTTGGNPVAVLLRNSSGAIIDFMCAVDAPSTQITSPLAIPAGQWSGSPVTANETETLTYQRQGQTDQGTAADWTPAAPSLGAINVGLTVPFTGTPASVAISPTTSGTFQNGVWSGNIVVTQPATGMYFRATDGSGHLGDSNVLNIVSSSFLSVNPADATMFAGMAGGPFTPAGLDFAVANAGSGSMDWTASQSANWLALSSTAGTLASGSSTTVTASLTAAANSLAIGNYSSVITFTNSAGGVGNTTRTVTLAVQLAAPTLNPEPAFTGGSDNNLAWTSVPGADAYEVQASLDPAFATLSGSSGWISTTTFTFSRLDDGARNYFRVRGHHAASSTAGLWSNVVSSTQDATTPTVAVTSPTSTMHGSIAVQGTASDASGIQSLMINGVAANTSDAFVHWSAPSVALADGTTIFTVVATDKAVPPNTTSINWPVVFLNDADADGVPDAWESQFNLGLGQPGHGANGDTDLDGISTLLEYGLNLDPRNPDRLGLPTIGKATNPADGKLYLTFSYNRRIGGGGLSYIVELSTDLVTWTPAGSSAEEIAPPTPNPDGITERVTLRIKPSLNTPGVNVKTVRLRVTSQ